MVLADTNLLLRALIHDASAPAQCQAATQWFLAQRSIWVPQIVQAELVWALKKFPGFDRRELVKLLSALDQHPAVKMQEPDAFSFALQHLLAGGDFADGLILYEANRANATLFTFDVNFAKRSGSQLLSV
jgi:predicted nucleic-acid-binding protein